MMSESDLLRPRNAPASDVLDLASLRDRVRALNARFRHHSATDVMRAALTETGKTALVSSFGAESAVLLHMVAITDKALPVLFIDTEMLFTETLVYQQELSERLGLTNVQIVRGSSIRDIDPDGQLLIRLQLTL